MCILIYVYIYMYMYVYIYICITHLSLSTTKSLENAAELGRRPEVGVSAAGGACRGTCVIIT